MNVIRTLIARWPAAAVLCAVIALALAVTVSAAGSHRSQQTKATAQPQGAAGDVDAPAGGCVRADRTRSHHAICFMHGSATGACHSAGQREERGHDREGGFKGGRD